MGHFLQAIVYILFSILFAGVKLLSGEALYAAQGKQLIYENNQFYKSSSLTTEHGLPANGINDIMQDQQGYIWIASFNGLVRYDGLSIKEYNVSNVEGLNSNRFHVVMQDRSGNIWAGVQDNTLLKIAANKTSVHTIRIDGADVRAEVTALSEGPDGAIWIGAHSGLFRFSEGEFTRIDAVPRHTVKYITHSYTHTYIVQQENIYRAEHDGSKVSLTMSLSGGTLDATGSNAAERAVEPSSFFVSIAPEDDFYWLLTNKDLFKIEYDRTQIRHTISGAALGFNNLLGLSLEEGRMFVYGSHGLSELFIPAPESDDQRLTIRSFSDQFIRNMVIDYEGTFWLATRAGGVKRFVPTPINIDSGFASLSQTAITSVTGSADGAVWFGTNCDGLYRYFENELEQFSSEYGFANTCIWSVFEQSDGTIWAGTWSDGVYFRPPDAVMFQKFEAWDYSDDSIVLALFEDSAGVIWFGTYSQGLVRWDGETAEIIRDESGNKIATVRDIFEDEQNTLWIATDRGVGYVKDGRFLAQPKFDILSTNAFRTIARDAHGRFLFGSFGGGMVVYSPGQAPFAVTAESGLLDETISQLTTDHNGNLWIGGNRGLFMIDSLHAERFFTGESTYLPVTPFGVAEGMPNRETTGGFSPSLHLSDSGILYIPTVQGLAEIHTNQMRLNRKPPNTLIEEIIVDGVAFLPSEIDDIPHNVQQLVFRFTALSFMNPDYVRFQYRLEGFHTEWQSAGRLREAVFTSLPPGDYTFLVKATNNAGIRTEQAVGLSFHVTPPFWQTIWFYGLLIAISIGGSLGFTRYQINAGIRRENNLQQTVKEQTAAITREKNRVEEALNALKESKAITEQQALRLEDLNRQKNSFFANISHELRTPLTLIKGHTDLALNGKYGSLSEPLQTLFVQLEGNIGRLSLQIEQLLQLSRIESGTEQLHKVPLNMYQLALHLQSMFLSWADQKGITLIVELSGNQDAAWVHADKSKMEQVLINLISNAIKHTEKGGRVAIITQAAGKNFGNRVGLRVKDTGSGIPEDSLPFLFDRFFQASNAQKGGIGLGLAVVKEWVGMHQGEVRVNSKLGEGSAFQVFLPALQTEANQPTPETGPGAKEESVIIHPAVKTVMFEDLKIRRQFSVKPGKTNREHLPLILIAEDEAGLQEYLHELLIENYRVHIVNNGLEGLEAARELMPDLIISDIMMPVMDGFDFCRKLRNDPTLNFIPFVMLTARTDEEHQLAGLQKGADAYLPKPFNAGLFVETVKNQIDAKKRLWAKFANDQSYLDSAGLSGKDELFDKFEKLIIQQLNNEELNIAQLSEQLHVSQRQLQRKIKDLTGLTPKQYVVQKRLQTAHKLLKNNAGSVSEVAYAVGYGSLSQFSSAFKKEFGVSPSESID